MLPIKQLKSSLRLFHTTNGPVSSSLYARFLKDSAKNRSILKGKLLHAQIIISSGTNTYVQNNLLSMYAKCLCLEDARRVFEEMPHRDVVTWTAMIGAYAKAGNDEEALQLFARMRETSLIKPNEFTCASVLPAVTRLGAIEEGKRIHEDVIRGDFESDAFVGSALIDMYVKCGSLDDARDVFDKMPQRDVVLWNVMIEGYVNGGVVNDALKLFYGMQAVDVEPDAVTFSIIVRACTSLEMLQEMHGEIRKRVLVSNVFVGNALVDMYAKFGNVDAARKVFDEMPEQNVILWNMMIRGYVQNNALIKALELFDRMPEKDVVSCNTVIAGYADNGHFDEAQKLFCKMPKRDVVSWNTMITASIKHGQAEAALTLFYEMLLTDIRPNAFTFASILPACVNLASLEHGRKIHEEINKAGFQFDVFVGSALVDMYVKCKSVEDARTVFDKIPKKNVVTWTAMIAGYAQNGQNEDAMDLFREMQLAGLMPDPKAFAVVIPVCANLAALEKGKEVHEHVLRSGLQSNVFVSSGLVDMYAKCGNIEDARSIFDKMPHRGVVSWNVMILGYAMHGLDMQALKIFDQMEQSGIDPDHVTFVGVLSACCHAGLVDKGWHYYKCMRDHYQITPTMRIYGCMVDLLGRAGNLVEAKNFIKKMPIIPDASIWKSFLGACRVHADVGLGEFAAEHLFELDSENPSSYVLLSNIYAQAGRWDGIEKVRKMMKDKGILKSPGCSWIEVNKQAHAFLAGDR